MSAPARLWLAAQHHKAFLNGGWAWVRAGGPELIGYVGGDRRTTRARMGLAGLAAALKGVAGEVEVHAAGLEATAIAALLAPPDPPAVDDLDLRKILSPRLSTLRLVRTEGSPGTRMAFAQAWADMASDRAKARGAFTAAIPRPNLAKAPGF